MGDFDRVEQAYAGVDHRGDDAHAAGQDGIDEHCADHGRSHLEKIDDSPAGKALIPEIETEADAYQRRYDDREFLRVAEESG